ncbi:MAG: hypothetical protein FWE67_12830 [Planctomycetaceae bacterium]|nr:hypothetical protein [Planctomycetaceae bacterium]
MISLSNQPDTLEALKAAFNEERMLCQEPVCDETLDKKRGLLKSADIILI